MDDNEKYSTTDEELSKLGLTRNPPPFERLSDEEMKHVVSEVVRLVKSEPYRPPDGTE